MATNRIQLKRTFTSGRTPNTTNSANSQYIAAGELALNLADNKLYTSNGSVLIDLTGGGARYFSVNQPGYVAGAYTGQSRYYPAENISIIQLSASVSEVVFGNNVQFKVFKNGVDTGSTYSINIGDTQLNSTAVTIDLTTTDYLTLNMVAGTAFDLRVNFKYTTS